MVNLDKEIDVIKHKKQELLNLIGEYEELKVNLHLNIS
jgi:hypothetical protein